MSRNIYITSFWGHMALTGATVPGVKSGGCGEEGMVLKIGNKNNNYGIVTLYYKT